MPLQGAASSAAGFGCPPPGRLKLAFLAGLMAGAASCSSPQKPGCWDGRAAVPAACFNGRPGGRSQTAAEWRVCPEGRGLACFNGRPGGRSQPLRSDSLVQRGAASQPLRPSSLAPKKNNRRRQGGGGKTASQPLPNKAALYNASLDGASRKSIGWRKWRNFKSRRAGRQKEKEVRLSAFPPIAAAHSPQEISRSAYSSSRDKTSLPLSAPRSKRAAGRRQAGEGGQKASARGGISRPASPSSENTRSAGKTARRPLPAGAVFWKNQASRKTSAKPHEAKPHEKANFQRQQASRQTKPSAKARAAGKQAAPLARDPFARPDFLSLAAAEIPARAAAEKSPPALAKPFPFIKNGEVERWIWFFSRAGGPGYTKLWLKRAYRYIPLMKGILRSHGLPEELAYMTLIESSLSPRAVSSARAVGYWQFIKPTARRFGLQINSHVDERMDFQKSANAASRYLRQLQVEFQDWLLAMSAYNMGEARLRRLIKKHEERSFWNLARKPDFPRETALYIPKILAAVHIMKAPSLYGFRRFSILTPHKYDIFYVPGGTNVKKMFREANLSIKSLRALNPELRGAAAPKFPPLYKLRVPKGSGKSISNWLKDKKNPQKTSSKKAPGRKSAHVK